MDHKRVQISGMTCEGCAGTVKSLLSSIDGISNVVIDLPSNSAMFDIDDTITTLEHAKDSLKETNYRIVSE